MTPIILTGLAEPEPEDQKMALIATIYDDNDDNHIFVRIQSYDETREHPVMNQLKNKKVKVTIEIIEE